MIVRYASWVNPGIARRRDKLLACDNNADLALDQIADRLVVRVRVLWVDQAFLTMGLQEHHVLANHQRLYRQVAAITLRHALQRLHGLSRDRSVGDEVLGGFGKCA